ncbi:E3 ubiquitin-protein ligase rnf8 isoform X2 [Bemisia tabaci]|uniref:E3 ubiquitin-protein ligase rnf8 isoform X2 n=1 Tax=Bemisia tabaci TaxID=7038 RepID=UPI003B28B601
METKMTDFLNYSVKELQCSICNELFIQPRIINCGHIICLFCLMEWKKEQKNCPLCRCLITSHCRCPTIDNIIDGIVRRFPESQKEERFKAVSSRDDVSTTPTIPPSLDTGNRYVTALVVRC